MGKSMDKRKRLIRGAAVFVVWAAIVDCCSCSGLKKKEKTTYFLWANA
jgi:hypothetical protein